MTREQEIKEMAKIKASHITSDKDMQVAFADALRSGAEWADQHPHWISVEDELPTKKGWILAIEDGLVNMWYYDNESKREMIDCYYVTHWMPLPQAPKEGGEE